MDAKFRETLGKLLLVLSGSTMFNLRTFLDTGISSCRGLEVHGHSEEATTQPPTLARIEKLRYKQF